MAMEQFALSGFSTSNMLACVVDGTDIYQTDYIGNRKLIGKTLSAYNELEQTTTEYYNKLVELGVIVPPKSQEELMAEMQKSMLQMSDIIAGLSNVPQRELKRGGAKGAGGNQRDGGQS